MTSAKRNENETFKSYRARLADQAKADKELSKGRVIWASSQRGTYVRAKDGDVVSCQHPNPNELGLGDDIACIKCGAVALDTGLECTECGYDMRPEIYPEDCVENPMPRTDAVQ